MQRYDNINDLEEALPIVQRDLRERQGPREHLHLRDLVTDPRQLVNLPAEVVIAVALVVLAVVVTIQIIESPVAPHATAISQEVVVATVLVQVAVSRPLGVVVGERLVEVLDYHLVVPCCALLEHDAGVVVAHLDGVQGLVLVLVDLVVGQNLPLQKPTQEDYDLA